MLCPTPRDLVPCVLNLTGATAYDAETILNLKLTDITEDARFRVRVIRFPGRKGRASDDPIVTTAAGRH